MKAASDALLEAMRATQAQTGLASVLPLRFEEHTGEVLVVGPKDGRFRRLALSATRRLSNRNRNAPRTQNATATDPNWWNWKTTEATRKVIRKAGGVKEESWSLGGLPRLEGGTRTATYVDVPYSPEVLEAAWRATAPGGVLVGDGYCGGFRGRPGIGFTPVPACADTGSGRRRTKNGARAAQRWILDARPWLRLYRAEKNVGEAAWWVVKPLGPEPTSRPRGTFIQAPGWVAGRGSAATETLEPNPLLVERRVRRHTTKPPPMEWRKSRGAEKTGVLCSSKEDGPTGMDAAAARRAKDADAADFAAFERARSSPDDGPPKLPKRLTFVYLYYQTPSVLEKQMEFWKTWPSWLRARVAILVVDDGSPDEYRARRVLAPLLATTNAPNAPGTADLEVNLAEILDDIPWNIGGARNLGVFAVRTPFLVMLDIDVIVPTRTAGVLSDLVGRDSSAPAARPGVVVVAFPRASPDVGVAPLKPHPATVLLAVDTYWRVGGCDEDFVGHYGATDPHFRFRAGKTKGVKLVKLSDLAPDRLDPLIQLKDGAKPKGSTDVLRRLRDPAHNKALYAAKKAGNISWAVDYLRFNWRLVPRANFSHNDPP